MGAGRRSDRTGRTGAVVSCDHSFVSQPDDGYYDGSLTGPHPAIRPAAATAVERAGWGRMGSG